MNCSYQRTGCLLQQMCPSLFDSLSYPVVTNFQILVRLA
jgi:hypothetical protein